MHSQPIDLERFYRELGTAAAGIVPDHVVARVHEGSTAHPIHVFGPTGPPDGIPILIVAGMHGNEIAGALAAPRILEDLRSTPDAYRRVRIHLIAPANPVGLEHGSRYNLQGCDINRDFRAFDTVEARAIRDLFDEVMPEVILSLHEGPHDGFFVIATRRLPDAVALAATRSIPATVMRLARENNLGWTLGTRGVMREGWFVTTAKGIFGIHSLGAYGEARGIPSLTTEGPWGSHDVAARVRAQVLAVRGIAQHLGSRSLAAAAWASPGEPRVSSVDAGL